VAEPDPKLVAIADDLYALAPDAFTQARDGRAQQARGEGELEAAKVIRTWRRPKTSAWLLNLLARERTDQLSQLFDLDSGLRDAQQRGDGERMRALSRQRRTAVDGLVSEARELSSTLSHPISDSVVREVETTLHAALTDPRAAAAVLTGRLITWLSPNGFDPVNLDGAVVLLTEPAPLRTAPVHPKHDLTGPSVAEPSPDDRSRVADATASVEEAAAVATQAETALSDAEQEVHSATARLDELRSRVSGLEAELDEARAAVNDGGRELRAARKARDAADREARAARRRLTDAESQLERLES
jgi:hypothetical protein